jgi:hypothetical protein
MRCFGRSIGILAISGASSFAFAQDILPASEDSLIASFQGFRQMPQFHIRVNGQNFRGSTTQSFIADLFWQNSVINGRTITRFELVEQYERGNGTYQVLNRLLADGVNLTRYDALAKEISSKQYGSVNGPQPTRYNDQLLDLIASTPADAANFAVRMVRDVFSGTEAKYSGWLPGNSRLANEYMLSFTLGVPKSRELQFHFNPVTQQLVQVRYEDVRNLGTVYRGTNWTMTVDSDFTSYVPFQPWPASATTGWKTVPWNSSRVDRSG